jgi:hypothetical protein
LCVVLEDEYVALLDPSGSQGTQSITKEHLRDASPSIRLSHDQMVNKTAATIMTAEDRSDNLRTGFGDEAQLRVPLEEALDGFHLVRAAQADAWC